MQITYTHAFVVTGSAENVAHDRRSMVDETENTDSSKDGKNPLRDDFIAKYECEYGPEDLRTLASQTAIKVKTTVAFR